MSRPHPFGILAELTYGCPLHCPYCSNPLDMTGGRGELTTAEWERVLAEAAELGALQAHLSGGEPLLRRDVTAIVRAASAVGLYTNLITSGLGLSRRRAEELRAAGLDHVQVSVQAAEAGRSDAIAGVASFGRKLKAARLVKELGWPLTLNVVLHRGNLDQVGEVIDLAQSLGADRLELANTQYYGWALANRAALLPSAEQVARAEAVVKAAAKRLREAMEIIWVLPDYHEKYPKPCMGGWGARQLTVTPYGDALPCPTAHEVPLPRANVTEHSLRWIWEDSPVFNAFRGTGWMPEPCRSCARRDVDFGGCRCQAFALTGNAARTDPVCELSPDHALVTAAIAASESSSPRGQAAVRGGTAAPRGRHGDGRRVSRPGGEQEPGWL
ncbi:MAG: pyrroloquinoline quinone biosynthesis protein PqqE [Nocardiopsaceae bacterium]|nr:pyrroloquinoline quinone biosynthesis protein PqqE [Nocardiopsaceae bacterium]